MTQVNEHCRNICRTFGFSEPKITNNQCTYCGSVTSQYLRGYLEGGGEIEWVEPLAGRMVEAVRLANGKLFQLTHEWDEPCSDVDVKAIQELLEEHAGDLRIFYREINKYFNL
jgi:hypothetical protein